MNKQINVKILFFLFCLSIISSDVVAFTYSNYSHGFFTSIYVLTVDPQEHMIVPVKALGNNIKRETVATLANRYGASAAINGGFWKLNGDPSGILKIDQQWYGTPTKPRGAIGWANHGKKVLIDKVLTNLDLSNCVNEDLIEVIPVSEEAHTTSQEWKEMEHIVGGTPVLISQGILIENYSSEQTLKSFLVKKHPRTAVGIKENGDWMFVVVDGSFFGFLGGMTINELANLMFNLGCVEALNLDGGGSSTMVLEGLVANKPCGKLREKGKSVEKVSDAILIFP